MLTEFFDAHITETYMVYGLCFLIFSLVVTINLRRLSRLRSTDAFTLLAVFGFIYGINEWIDALYVSGVEYGGLFSWMKLALLLFSFVVLMQFGLSLIISDLERSPLRVYLGWAPLGAFVIFLIALASFNIDPLVGEILARPLFGFTGAGLCALAILTLHKKMSDAGLSRPALLWMGVGFAAYAVFTGLVTPYQFPLVDGIPTPVFCSGCALVLAWSGSRTMIHHHTLFSSSMIEADRESIYLKRSPEACHSGLIEYVETLRGLVGGSAVTLFILAVEDFNKKHGAQVRADRFLIIEGVEDWDIFISHIILYLRKNMGPVAYTLAKGVDNPVLHDILGEIDEDAGLT